MAVSRRTASKPKSKTTRAAARAPARKRQTRRAARPLDQNAAIALAQSISGSREQFAETFRQAQRGQETVVEFEAVSSSIADKVSAVARAFLRAFELGWFNQLCADCMAARIVDEDFAAGAAKLLEDREYAASLQAMVDPAGGLLDEWYSDRINQALRQVCQIEIDGQATGTGFLIRPDLVMTAHHVVKPLLQLDNSESPASAGRLRVRFDYTRRAKPDGAVMVYEGFTCPAADPWLAATSPCTQEELLNTLPDDEERLNNFWDFAVIRLAELPSARDGLTLVNRPTLPGHELTVLQHPARTYVRYGRGPVRRFLGGGGYRVVHRVNTLNGSSGGPCLNDDFQVVCLHQASMPDPRKPRSRPSLAGDAPKENRAVPMLRILTFWNLDKEATRAVPFRPLLTAATTAMPFHPVFGRYPLQEWIERASANALSTNTNRFLTVTGFPGTGRSFTLDILRAKLRIAEHGIVACKASDWTNETTALGLVEKYFLPPLGASGAQLPPIAQANTSDNAWLNYQFIGDLLNVIDQARKGRTVWIVLDDLDRVVLPDQGQIRKLLDLLYARVEQTPWLRFVLIGLEAVPVPGTAQFTERDSTGTESQADLAVSVTEYFVRRLESWGVPVDRATIAASAALVVKLAAGPNNPNISDDPAMLRRLVDAVMAFEAMNRFRRGAP